MRSLLPAGIVMLLSILLAGLIASHATVLMQVKLIRWSVQSFM